MSKLLVRGPKGGPSAEYKVGAPIAAGSTVEVHATMIVNFSGSPSTAAVYLDVEGVEQRLKLGMTADVSERLIVKNRRVDLGSFARGIAKSGAATITSADGEPFLLQLDKDALAETPKCLSATLVPVYPDADGRAREWRVLAEIASDAPFGGSYENLALRTDLQRKGSEPRTFHGTSVFVNYKVCRPVELSEAFVSFGLMKRGASIEKRTRLTRFDPDIDFTAATITVQPGTSSSSSWTPNVTASIEPVEGNSSAYDIVLTWPAAPKEADGAYRGKATLELNQAGLPAMEIQFAGVVR